MMIKTISMMMTAVIAITANATVTGSVPITNTSTDTFCNANKGQARDEIKSNSFLQQVWED